jgi:non-specific riboncleoside hydrolase
MAQKILLDMDPGIDDAAAIAVALTDPAFEVQLLTTVAGNVAVDKTTENALKLVEFFGVADMVPVAGGAKGPLLKPFRDASDVHGVSGMPGWDFPTPTTKPLGKSAVEAMAEILLASEAPLTVVLTGAYTNAALLIREHPEVLPKIKQFVVMGGTLTAGNMSSVAEFNVYTDPHAAQIVFNAGRPVVMIGLNVTMSALLTHENIDRLKDFNVTGQALAAMINHYGDDEIGGKPMHDVNTLFYLVHPEAFTLADMWIDVATDGPAVGATVADLLGEHGTATNVKVALSVDAKLFNEWFMQKIASAK